MPSAQNFFRYFASLLSIPRWPDLRKFSSLRSWDGWDSFGDWSLLVAAALAMG